MQFVKNTKKAASCKVVKEQITLELNLPVASWLSRSPKNWLDTTKDFCKINLPFNSFLI